MSLQNNTNELNNIGSQIAHMKEEYGKQSGLIAQIKTVLEQKASGEVPPSKLASLVDDTITELTAQDLQGATKIRPYAFSSCKSLTSIEIPNTVTSIGAYAFQQCISLISIVMPDMVTSIGSSAFNGCSSLTSVVIGNNVTSIGGTAFGGCIKLTNLTIPTSVTSIGNSALVIGSSTNKATIRFLSTTPPTIQNATFYNGYLNQIIVPKGYGDTYKSKTNFSNFADLIVENET